MQGRLTIQAWVPGVLEGARLAAQFLLLVVIAYLLARLCWLVVAPGPAIATLEPRPLPTPVSQTNSSDVRADLSLVMTQNPFEAGDTGAGETVPDAPETDLNLKLVALFMSTGNSISSATIVTPDNEVTRYELGDEILPGVVLERVLSDRAIISREGRNETLMRSGREAGLSVIGDTSAAWDEASRVTTESPPLFEPGVTARTLLAGMDVEARMENGRTTGLVLRPRGDASLMNSAGLEPGDRVVSVNGTQVAEIDSSSFASRLTSASITTVSLVRSGDSRTIEIRFEEE